MKRFEWIIILAFVFCASTGLIFSCFKHDEPKTKTTEEIATSAAQSGRTGYSNGFNGARPVEQINTTAARVTIDAVKPSGKAEMFECAMLVETNYGGIQMGYRKSGGAIYPFTDIRLVPEVLFAYPNGGDGPWYPTGKNEFEIKRTALNVLTYYRNGTAVVEYTFPGEVNIYDCNVHTLLLGYASVKTITFYGLQYDSAGTYVTAKSMQNIYGSSTIGYAGNKQDSTIRVGWIKAGTGIINDGWKIYY